MRDMGDVHPTLDHLLRYNKALGFFEISLNHVLFACTTIMRDVPLQKSWGFLMIKIIVITTSNTLIATLFGILHGGQYKEVGYQHNEWKERAC